MISAEYCRLMSRYNTWQNTSLVTAADGLTEIARHENRGAFFQSIAATLKHPTQNLNREGFPWALLCDSSSLGG